MTSTNDTKTQQNFAERALAMVREKLGERQMLCQLCGVNDWNLEGMPAFVALWDVDSDKKAIFPDSQIKGLPLVALTCKNCGNTLFVNTMVLGIGDLVEGSQPKHD